MSKWFDQLQKDLDWRETELAALKVQVISVPKPSVKYRALLRAIWALLYAHYEGFCKFAWDFYLDELTKAGVKRKDCKVEIAQLSLQKKIKELRGNSSIQKLWDFGSVGFTTLLEENLDFTVKLDTQSNLYPDLFKENSLQAGLSCTLVDQYKIQLEGLVKRRNAIAHGEQMIIKDLSEYEKYEKAAIEVMYELAILINECLDKKLYLK